MILLSNIMILKKLFVINHHLDCDNVVLSGFRAGPYDTVLSKSAILNAEFANCKTADEYIYNFLFKNINRNILDDADICTAFRKQAALVYGFSLELDEQLQTLDDYAIANNKFQSLTKSTGFNGIGSVTSIRQFIELMSISGLLHGCTHSLTRLAITSPMVALMNRDSEKFTIADINYVLFMGLTITGSLEGYSVFSSTLPYKDLPYNVLQVLKKYEGRSAALKNEFFSMVTKEKDNFSKFGFIMTDHGPEGIDGKQYTFSTYI